MNNYIFDYINENEFRKLENSLKKYNMLAYKKMHLEYFPLLREGKFLGKIIATNQETKTVTYELKLPTDIMFEKVHGDINLYYLVYPDKKVIMLDKISPEKILSEGHQSELVTYKGVMVSNQDREKDMFKINLLDLIQK